MNDDLTAWKLAREAARRARAHADTVAKDNDWELGGGFWADEASDHLYDEREALGKDVWKLAEELLKEMGHGR